MKHAEIIAGITIMLLAGCGMDKAAHYRDMNPAQYRAAFAGKRVFIDPGHGGLGKTDTFRIGPAGLREEEANLAVALELEHLLQASGAIVKMARDDDSDISLAERSAMAAEFRPDLLLSIHHNGTIRRVDPVNYPLVLFWGNEKLNPASFQLAQDALREFERLMDMKGVVLSDYSVFQETGTHILRETKHLCPGILGEAGFFSDATHERRLKDTLYIREEAKAYYYTMLTYFSRGCPVRIPVNGPIARNRRTGSQPGHTLRRNCRPPPSGHCHCITSGFGCTDYP
jgi:N-acetylmuramoyl-L-alanine amidase